MRAPVELNVTHGNWCEAILYNGVGGFVWWLMVTYQGCTLIVLYLTTNPSRIYFVYISAH